MTTNSANGYAKRSQIAHSMIQSSCNYANLTTDIIGTFCLLHNSLSFTNGRFIVEFHLLKDRVIVSDTFYQVQTFVHLVNHLLAVF